MTDPVTSATAPEAVSAQGVPEDDGGSPWRGRLLRWGVTIVVLVVVGFAFADAVGDAWTKVRDEDLGADWRLAVAGVLFAAAVPVSGLLWGRVLEELSGRRVDPVDAVAVQCSSWLLKYVPGQVGSVVNKVVWGQRRGYSRTTVLVSFVYENVFLQLASLVPATAILVVATGSAVFADHPAEALLPLVLIVPLAALAFGPGLRIGLHLAIRKVLKRDPTEQDRLLSTPRSLTQTLWFVLPRLPNAAGFVLIAASVTSISIGDWLPLGAAYVFGGAIGILAVFVPSGLGVRESVTVLFARQFIDTSDAIIVALLARLVSVVADLGVLGVYGAARLHLRRTTP